MFLTNRFNRNAVTYTDENGEILDDNLKVGYYPVSLCERAGYKPPRLQVLDFLIAGERLIASNREKYYQSDFEIIEDDKGNIVMPKLARSYDPLTAKKNLDEFNSKFSNYLKLVHDKEVEKYNRHMEEIKMYKEYYDKEHNKTDTV